MKNKWVLQTFLYIWYMFYKIEKSKPFFEWPCAIETVEPVQSSFKSSPQNAFLSVFLAFVWTVHSLARFCLSRFGIVGDWDGMSRFAQGQTVQHYGYPGLRKL